MEPYRATQDLLAVTRRIGALQLERSILLATSVHDDATRGSCAAEVERELNALGSALDTVAMLLSAGPNEPDESDSERAAATPQLDPDVSRELEAHMARVEQLAVERDVLEAEITAASPGESRARSQRLLHGVEIELSELECTLDELARQLGGEDGPLSWAISPRARGQEDSPVTHDDAPAKNNDISRRAEARAQTRALLDGGLGHAMQGLRPSG